MKNFSKLLCIILSLCLCCPVVSVFAESTTASGVTLQSDDVRELPEGENLISGELPIYVDYTPPNKKYIERTELPESTKMTDGDVNTDWLTSKLVFADYKNGNPEFYGNGEVKCYITYFLDDVIDITKMCIVHHKESVLRTAKYELYAAKDLRTLYWPGSRIAYVENLDAMSRQILTCNVQDVTFIGIKILAAVQPGITTGVLEVTASRNNHYPRINEFAVYGTRGGVSNYPIVTNTSNKTVVSTEPPITEELGFSDPNLNFFYGKTPKAYKYKPPTTFLGITISKEGETEFTPTNASSLTDGILNMIKYSEEEKANDPTLKDVPDFQGSGSKVEFVTRDETTKVVTLKGSDTNYVDIRIDAGSPQNLGVFYIKHHDTRALRTMHYRIFASTKSGRPEASTMIAECYNYDDTQEHYFVVANGQTITARYYTIRIYDPCFDYTAETFAEGLGPVYPRFLEVAAFTPDAISAKLELDNFQKVDGTNYGYINPGTEVKSVLNSFIGRGSVRVEDKDGNLKAPSDALECGDKVIADTDYGTDFTAGFKFRGDLDNSDSFTISDIKKLCDSIIDGTPDLTLGDVDNNSYVNVTDVICLEGIVAGLHKGVKDTSDSPSISTKLGVLTNGEYEVTVDTDTVINEEFRGFGTNSFTSILSPEGMAAYGGYNRVYHELTEERMAAMKPTVSRVWFQPDWITTKTLGDEGYKDYIDNPLEDPDYLNYKNGIYDFENETMQAFYEYVEMLDRCGCTIEINFGWKTATRIQYWFNAPCGDDYMLGAPQDLEAFGNAAAALIKYLNKEKGYDFIEAITFYNEPSHEGDFQITTVDEKLYWSQLIHQVDASMKKMGVRDLVEIWGPEVSGIAGSSAEYHREWIQYQIDNTASCIDQWTGHLYCSFDGKTNNYTRTFETLLSYSKLTNKNMMITEMYGAVINDGYKDWYNWNDSFTGYFIAVSNTGTKGLLSWGIVGGYIPNPLYFKLDGNTSAAWKLPKNETDALCVQRAFYEESLLTNYVPDGSKVLYTGWIGRDIKAAAYRLPDGNITVIVENNGINNGAVLNRGTGANKTVTVNFSDGEDRTFNRISYIPDEQVINANATVNIPDKQIEAENGAFTDNYGEQYSVHLYTTAPIVKQIEMDNVIVHTTPTQPVSVKGKMIDCAANDEIVYTISEFTGAEAGFVSGNGNYTPATSAKKGDMIAVRASLKSDPNIFGVSIIYID